MALITFMSDFGEEDQYVAAVKARIMGINPGIQIVDISHRIAPFDIAHGAFVLKYVFEEFPQGTVHLIAVDSAEKIPGRHIILKLKEHYFVGADNGLLSLISEDQPSLMAEIINKKQDDIRFPARDILAPAAARLASGKNINDIGIYIEDFKRLLGRQLKATKSQINGNVIRVDNYGNLITNIEKKIFDMIHKDRNFEIRFSRESIKRIHRQYGSVEPGECAVLFNSLGLLEISINKGNASELLGLDYDSPVTINFSDK
jgi:S-adenosylmethionine hydrolase